MAEITSCWQVFMAGHCDRLCGGGVAESNRRLNSGSALGRFSSTIGGTGARSPRVRLTRHAHGGMGLELAHRPRIAFPASSASVTLSGVTSDTTTSV